MKIKHNEKGQGLIELVFLLILIIALLVLSWQWITGKPELWQWVVGDLASTKSSVLISLLVGGLIVGTLLFGLGSPIFMKSKLSEMSQWEVYQSGILGKFGVMGVFTGLTIALFAPTYLSLEQPLRLVVTLFGAAIFFSFGVGCLLANSKGDAGFALGFWALLALFIILVQM